MISLLYFDAVPVDDDPQAEMFRENWGVFWDADLLEDDPAPESRGWIHYKVDDTLDGVLWLVCPKTGRLAVVLDATPEEIEAAPALFGKPWSSYPERVYLTRQPSPSPVH